MTNCWFIAEDSIENEYTSMPPNENDVERSIPFTLSNNRDMETYKHYIYSFISEKMERIHISSSHRYVAIYGFLFKVVRLNSVGVKFQTQGHQFLNQFRCLRIVYGKHDTCIFNTFFHQAQRRRIPKKSIVEYKKE